MEAQRQQFVEGAKTRGVEPAARRPDLRPDGEIRRLRLQQIACRRLCARRLPDRLSQGQPSGRVHGGVDDPRPRQHRQAELAAPGIGPARHPAAAARHQPLAADLLGRSSRPQERQGSRRSAMRWPRSRGSARRRCEVLVAERDRNGRFKDLFDLAQRLDARTFNRGQFESLAKAGAFDPLDPNRAQTFAAADLLLRQASRSAMEREDGQGSLFGARPRRSSGVAAGRRLAAGRKTAARIRRDRLLPVEPSARRLRPEPRTRRHFALGRFAERVGGEWRHPVPPRRHRPRPQGTHFRARQSLCVRADVGSERRLRGDPVRRNAERGARAVRRRASRSSSPSMCAARRTACG